MSLRMVNGARVRATVVCLLAVAPAAAAAQEPQDTFLLPEVVVTATRLRTPVQLAPGTVTVLHGAELRARGIRYVADALRTVPGVTVMQGGGPGGLTAVFMRGGESDYVQVLVDGVQVNDPGGAYNWAHLRADDIERIEIVRGPASVLYGSDAVAGVVQIFTRAGGSPRIEVGASGSRGERPASGTFDAGAVDAAFTGRVRAPGLHDATLRFGVSGAHATSGGLYPFNSEYDNTVFGGRVQLAARATDAAVTARHTRSAHHYPTSGSGAVFDRNQHATGDALSLGMEAGHRLWPVLELRVAAALHETDTRTDDPPDTPESGSFRSTAEQQRRTLDARANIALLRASTLTLGAEREWQRASTAFESVSPQFGTFTGSTRDARSNTGWYAQLHSTALRGVAATAGARIDDNERFGTFHTGRIALSWQPRAGARLHGAFGTAFKEPTFFENFATGFARGNPDLEPEQTRSWEAGAEYAVHGATVSATWFRQRFRNLIQYTFEPPAPEAPNYFNVGAARAHGVELGARAAAERASIAANYTWTRTRVLDDGFGLDPAFDAGRPLLRRPEHQASVTSTVRLVPSLHAQLDARFTGARDDLDFTDPAQFSGVRTRMPGYTTVDAGLLWHVPFRDSDVEITLRARNLFDERYQEIYNFPAAGRVLMAGMRAGIGW